MIPEPTLLIIAPLPDDFDLAQIPLSKTAGKRISVNIAKFCQLEMVEVIVDAMPFLLARFAAAETAQRFAAEKYDLLFCDLPPAGHSAIGVAPRDNVISAKHLPEVNHRLLMLGQWIGESVNANTAAWMPCRRLASFSYYSDAVMEYLSGGPFPTLLQTSFCEVREGHFETNGLHYFAGQEIRLTAPPAYGISDITERLVRIIDDIATHGRIEKPGRSTGMVEGETLIYLPSDDLEHVDIIITSESNRS